VEAIAGRSLASFDEQFDAQGADHVADHGWCQAPLGYRAVDGVQQRSLGHGSVRSHARGALGACAFLGMYLVYPPFDAVDDRPTQWFDPYQPRASMC
jgi:hypothetical protein